MIVLRALGTAEIDTGVTTLTPSQEIVFAAALYLILERGKRVSRTRLASLLWPRVPEKARSHRLRQTILQLKKLGIMVWADRDNLQLSQYDARSDFDDLTGEDITDVGARESLEFLPGYNPRLSEALRDWVETKRGPVHAASTRILVRDLEQARLQADWTRVERVASQCLSLDAYNETAILAQAEAAAMRGGKRKAMFILDRYLSELGDGESQLRLPANLLRRRIVERVPDRPAMLNADPVFVGRQAEMEKLVRSFERAQNGKGSGALLLGEPGIGKSRLCAEVGRFADLQGAQVQRATCRRTGVDRPLSLFVDIVPDLREMPGALGCAPETFALLKRLTEFEQRHSDASGAADSELLFRNVQTALFDLLDSVAEERCLVIIIEDVHWLDDVSARILARMVEWCASRSLFFLMNSRPSNRFFNQYAEKASLDTLLLAPLNRKASIALLQSVALRPADEPESDFVGWCLGVAEGNPFFLQELARQWIETGHRHEAPPSVTKVLQERLARLSEEALRVLQSCAILSDHATFDRVEKVLEYPPHLLLTAVEELSKAAMLSVPGEGFDTGAGYLQPKHDFLSSAAMARLSPVSLAFLHRRVADVLEREIVQEAMATTLLWACASHRHHAGDRERALFLSLSCAEHLLDMGLARDSCVAFHKSLDHCMTDEQRLRVLPRLAVALQMDGKWDRSKDVLQTCVRLSAKVQPTSTPHNDFELLLLEAKYQSSFEYSTLLDEIVPCVECLEATPRHRVRAAIMALKIATDTGPADVVDSLYHHVAPLLENKDIPKRSRLELEIVYRTLRGNDVLPVAALREFADSADKSDGLGYFNALLTAASACRISGRYNEGMEFVSEATEYLMSHKLTNRLPQALIAAVRLHCAVEAFDKADLALRDVLKQDVASDDPQRRSEPSFLEARIAIERGDLSRASNAFGKLERVPQTFSASRRAYYFALAVHIKLMERATRDEIEPLVAALEEAHLFIQGIGTKDFESYALFLGLRAIGEGNRGADILREYVGKHRRSRWPLSQNIQAAIGFTALATLESRETTLTPWSLAPRRVEELSAGPPEVR
jgi:DNA-binding SARP family transcriptional activator